MPAPKPKRRSDQAVRPRPSKEERHRATVHVLVHYGDTLRSTARRFAATAEDADDAFQRGIEIALEKAPATDVNELVRWLRTVIKHEAFALRRKAARSLPRSDEPEVLEHAVTAPDAADDAIVLERLAIAADALKQLKPQEARAIRLKVEGLSYNEIRAETGWTYTKVNRCLTEGRARLRELLRVAE